MPSVPQYRRLWPASEYGIRAKNEPHALISKDASMPDYGTPGNPGSRVEMPLWADQARNFWRHVDKSDPIGCWIWTAYIKKGYGRFTAKVFGKNKTIMAHRGAWELTNGLIPAGMQLDHRVCRLKSCVNPSHLVVCTPLENSEQPDGTVAIHRNKTHCPRGHEYSEGNTRVYQGKRFCRACDNDRSKERNRRLQK